MYGQASAAQKATFARLFNLYKHYAVLRGTEVEKPGRFSEQEYTSSGCEAGVIMAENAGQAHFQAESICNWCTYFLSEDASRSRSLCQQGSYVEAVRSSRVASLPPSDSAPASNLRVHPSGAVNSDPVARVGAFTNSEKSAKRRRSQLDETSVSTLARLEAAVSDLQAQIQVCESIVLRNLSWGITSQYSSCSLGLSWQQLLEGAQGLKTGHVRTGGLGSAMVLDKYEVWLCSKRDDERCAYNVRLPGDYMCYVFNEQTRAFEPWGLNSELRLVKGGPFDIGPDMVHTQLFGAVMALREELNELRQRTPGVAAGSSNSELPVQLRQEQNFTTSLWRETGAIWLGPGANEVRILLCFFNFRTSLRS